MSTQTTLTGGTVRVREITNDKERDLNRCDNTSWSSLSKSRVGGVTGDEDKSRFSDLTGRCSYRARYEVDTGDRTFYYCGVCAEPFIKKEARNHD